MKITSGKLFVISAPSGTGKTTLLKRVMSEVPNMVFSISHTTRKPRDGERDGVDYHFVNEPTFLAMRASKLFIESAFVHQNYYGTSHAAVMERLEAGIDVVLDIDVQGANILMEQNTLPASYIFIAPPNLEVLEKRLRKRGSDSEETIKVRMENAVGELAAQHKYDYLVVNNELEQATRLLTSIVWAERSKARRSPLGNPLEIETSNG